MFIVDEFCKHDERRGLLSIGADILNDRDSALVRRFPELFGHPGSRSDLQQNAPTFCDKYPSFPFAAGSLTRTHEILNRHFLARAIFVPLNLSEQSAYRLQLLSQNRGVATRSSQSRRTDYAVASGDPEEGRFGGPS
jgi:hypothetical protein